MIRNKLEAVYTNKIFGLWISLGKCSRKGCNFIHFLRTTFVSHWNDDIVEFY